MKSTCLSLYAALCLISASGFAQTTSYTISTFAGTGTPGFFGDGTAANSSSAELNTPIAVALDSSGNLYIADSANQRIRKVTKSTGKISTIAGNGTVQYTGDGGAATSATFNTPYGVAVDSAGNVYIADFLNHAVRKVNTSGTISTVAGTGIFGFSGDGGPGTNAQLNRPFGLAVDSAGNLFIADSNNYCIRKLDTNGNISTVAGVATSLGFSGDGGPATSAKMSSPYGVAVDKAGNLYIADSGNNRIRKVSNGIITTIAGAGPAGYSGDGGSAVSARLNRPFGVSVDSAGNVFVSDYGNYRVRLVSANGVINTLAGFAAGYGGDGGPAINATLSFPTGTVSDPSTGNVYIADSGNNVIRLMTPSAPAVSGVVSAGQFGALPAVAPGSWIEIYGANLATNVRSWTGGDFTNGGLTAPTALDGNAVTIGGQPAYIDYISGTQINAQVPSNVGTGSQSLVVTNANGGKATATVTVNAVEPGVFAPSSFVIGGKQYAGAVANDGVTFILPPGAVPGITSQRANPGDRITFYGVGFGPVTPASSAGQVVQSTNSLPSFQMQIGGTPATVQYAGLAPGAIGLYQINVFVPTSASPNDLTPVTFTVNGTNSTQTLYVAIQ
jgi:trimeric autotransporter adhesin